MSGRRKRRPVRTKNGPRRTPELIHDPAGQRALDAVQKRVAWYLVTGGAAAIAAGSALGITLNVGFLLLALLGGLAFALGLCGLSERKQIALPAFAVGLAAPFVLTFGGHSVLMNEIGHTERCTVTKAVEHPRNKYPSVDYVLACPSGEVELDRDWPDRLKSDDAEVRVGPPLRPVFAEPGGWNLWLVTSVPLTMIALVPLARALRKKP
ncbi:hypothetical protein BBK82_19135 [Lentzea guizhouensis]|uniref:Uncharacterized protein n=1 Tax=Lentzea guizhouensis TaxID=1586287 RepID=A0A1B2HJI4_9PSEU|nr:hypothetical protein [Lentzea guizhouensis]ANZ37862.1 hypothetical protein BBK82_19135 [Lentzea guizhouensis]